MQDINCQLLTFVLDLFLVVSNILCTAICDPVSPTESSKTTSLICLFSFHPISFHFLICGLPEYISTLVPSET